MNDTTARQTALRTMNLILDAVAATCRVITGVSLVVLTVIFGWLVYGRYVLNATPTWVEQVALLLVMTIAFLGSAVGVHEHTHLSVTMLRTSVGRRMRTLLVILTDILLGGFGLLMCLYGWQLTVFKWGSQIPLIGVPEGLRSLPLTIGGALIFIFTLGHLARLFSGCDERSDSVE